MSKYLSIDTEATGLEEKTHLIQIALVPVDAADTKVWEELATETLVACPSFEDLKPTLNPWVIEHNERLIRDASANGIAPSALRRYVSDYLERPRVKAFFGGERPVLLGKSLSALDIPLITRYLGHDFMQERFHHHTLDVTCVAKAFVDVGVLPPGFASTSKIIKHFGIREDARHTALSDAIDVANVYFKLLELASRARQ